MPSLKSDHKKALAGRGWRGAVPLSGRGCVTLLLASLFTLSSVLTQPVLVYAQDSEDETMAMFEQAAKLYRDGHYRAAIAIFRSLFKKDPSPYVLFNIGRCYEKLGDFEQALKYYQRSLAIAGLPENVKIDALGRLERLEPLLKRRRKERNARNHAIGLVDRARFVAKREADRPKTAPKVVVAPGPSQTSSDPNNALFWGGIGTMGVGAALLGAGTYFYFGVSDDLDRHQELVDEFERIGLEALQEDNGQKAKRAIAAGEAANALADEIEADQTLSTILLVSGGVLVVAGGALAYLGTTESEQPAVNVRFFVTPSGAGFAGSW